MVIEQEFLDAETAKTTGRMGFTAMISYFEQHPGCRLLLVEKTDRLYRNFKDYLTIDELDLKIHLVKENVILTKDSRSSEKFMHGIKVHMAKNYIDNLREEVQKGLRTKAAQGLYPSFRLVTQRTPRGRAAGAAGLCHQRAPAPIVEATHLRACPPRLGNRTGKMTRR